MTNLRRSLCLTAAAAVIVAAFTTITNRPQCRFQNLPQRSTSTELQSSSSSWHYLQESFNQAISWFSNDLLEESTSQAKKNIKALEQDAKSSSKYGTIVRTAARKFDKTGASLPASRNYTTRKDTLPWIVVTSDGVIGDYNHYRTRALSSTPNRAISILTTDVVKYVQSFYPSSRDGDLGENLLIDGMSFRSIRVGDRVQIGMRASDRDGDANVEQGGVVVLLEITEPMEPCANLCKLPYINDERLEPKDRIARCKSLIDKLGIYDGLRGWYAKVLQEGTIRVGDEFRLAAATGEGSVVIA